MREGVTEERIKEVVELVRLSNRINDKVSKYSLGMRQRLGVAQAILHRPKLLILDEPTNGLDPQGIKELRDILKELAHKEGTCVVVSSTSHERNGNDVRQSGHYRKRKNDRLIHNGRAYLTV